MTPNGIGGAPPRTIALRGADSAGASASHRTSAGHAPAALGNRSRGAGAEELGPLTARRTAPREGAAAQGDQVRIELGPEAGAPPGPPARTSAADLKAKLAQLSTPKQQLEGFQAAVLYQENTKERPGDARTAIGNAALTTGATAAVTFGSTRYLGTSVAGAAAATSNPVGNQFTNNALGAALGAFGHGVSQYVLPFATDTLLNKKMTPIPVEALVPQTGDVLTEHQQALRTEIKEKQAQLMNIGSASNALIGSSTFAAARLVASAAQLPVTGPAGWGATAAVSAAGGAALGAIQAQRQSAATHKVPNPSGEGPDLDMKLFYPKPTDPSFQAPWVPKTGTVLEQAGQIGLSAAARAGNLFVAGVPLQAAAGVGSTVAAAAGGGASGLAAQTALNTAAMFTGAGAYFVGLPHVGKVDAKTLQPAPPEPPV